MQQPQETPAALDYLYKEYARLSDKVEAVLRTSWDDFKLLGAVGIFIGLWSAAPQIQISNTAIGKDLLFLGFMGMLFIVAILGTRDLIKQASIEFGLREMEHYESRIKEALGSPDADTFSFASHWRKQRSERWGKAIAHFYLVFILVMLVPIAVLVQNNAAVHAGIYAAALILFLGINYSGARIIFREP